MAPNDSATPSLTSSAPPPRPRITPSKLWRPASTAKFHPYSEGSGSLAKKTSKKHKMDEDGEGEQIPKTPPCDKKSKKSVAEQGSLGHDTTIPKHAADTERGLGSFQSFPAESFTNTVEPKSVVKHAVPAPRSGPPSIQKSKPAHKAARPSRQPRAKKPKLIEDHDQAGLNLAPPHRLKASKQLQAGFNSALQQEESDTDSTASDDCAAEESDTDPVQSSGTASSNSADSTTLEHPSRYAANPATGRPAGVEPTGIHSIPPEVRIRIFGYLLVEEKDISLQLKRFQYKQHLIRAGSRRELGVALMDPVHNCFMAPTPTKAAVLSVCKSFYTEAAGVLYGENAFFFESTTVLANFLDHIGEPTAMLLKHIKIEVNGYVLKTAPRAATGLLKAPNLRTLTLPHGEVCSPYWTRERPIVKVNAEKIVKDFGKILGPLKTSYERQNIKANVLDVIVFAYVTGCKEFNWKSNDDNQKAKACNETKQKELRDAFAGYLGIAEGGDVAEDGKPLEANGSTN